VLVNAHRDGTDTAIACRYYAFWGTVDVALKSLCITELCLYVPWDAAYVHWTLSIYNAGCAELPVVCNENRSAVGLPQLSAAVLSLFSSIHQKLYNSNVRLFLVLPSPTLPIGRLRISTACLIFVLCPFVENRDIIFALPPKLLTGWRSKPASNFGEGWGRYFVFSKASSP